VRLLLERRLDFEICFEIVLFIIAKILKFKLKTAIINDSCEDGRITLSFIFIILLVVLYSF